MFTLLNVMAVEPATVPAPTKFTIPVPAVNVPLLVMFPAPAKLTVPVPAVNVPLLVMVPAPAKLTVPAPDVTVPLLVIVPPALIFKVAAALQLKVPALVTLPTVAEPPAPENVNVPVPTVVKELVTVNAAMVAETFAMMPVLTVIEVTGLFAIAAEIVKLCAMVTAVLVVGVMPPNQDAPVFQSVAPKVVINPK